MIALALTWLLPACMHEVIWWLMWCLHSMFGTDHICTSFQLPSKGWWTGAAPRLLVGKCRTMDACDAMRCAREKGFIGDEICMRRDRWRKLKSLPSVALRKESAFRLHACMFYDNKRLLPFSLAQPSVLLPRSSHPIPISNAHAHVVLPFIHISKRYFLVSKLHFILSLI